MTLTPAILTFLDKYPEEWQRTYCLEYIRATGREEPAQVAHEHAFDAAESTYKGLTPETGTQGRVSKEEWLRGRIQAVWDIYQAEAEASHLPDHLLKRVLSPMVAKDISRCFMAWKKASTLRTGRDPHQCVKDQVRGAFEQARQQLEAHSPVIRLDPEFVFGVRGKGWTRAKGWAELQWTKEAFTE